MKTAALTEINLLPGSDRRPKKLIAIISLLLVGGAIAGGGNCYYHKEQQFLAKLALINSDLAAQIETRTRGREDIKTLMNMQMTIDEMSPLLMELEAKRMPFVTILEEIYSLVPPDTSLDRIIMGDSSASIYGKSLNNRIVAQIIDNLKSLPCYGGLLSMQSKLDESDQGTEFVIEIALKE